MSEDATKIEATTTDGLSELLRLYWIPVLPSADLAVDGQPVTVKLLDETLIAFRNSKGEVGLVDNVCPHRGAPLVFGRNEDCGLRCVYHGWKFDVDGSVVDMPAEPARSRLKERVKIKSHPCVEEGGLIWAYMGKGAENIRPQRPPIEGDSGIHRLSLAVEGVHWASALERAIEALHIQRGLTDNEGRLGWREDASGFEIVVGKSDSFTPLARFVYPFYLLGLNQAGEYERGIACVPMSSQETLVVSFGESAGPHTGNQTDNAPLGDGGAALLEPYGRYSRKRPAAGVVGAIFSVLKALNTSLTSEARLPAHLGSADLYRHFPACQDQQLAARSRPAA